MQEDSRQVVLDVVSRPLAHDVVEYFVAYNRHGFWIGVIHAAMQDVPHAEVKEDLVGLSPAVGDLVEVFQYL